MCAAVNPLFSQAFYQLELVKSPFLRSPERAFQVELLNEGAQDQGGPYRDAMAQICEEVKKFEYLRL